MVTVLKRFGVTVLVLISGISFFVVPKAFAAENPYSFFTSLSQESIQDKLESWKTSPVYLQNYADQLFEIPVEKLLIQLTIEEAPGLILNDTFIPATEDDDHIVLYYSKVTINNASDLLSSLFEEHVQDFSREVQHVEIKEQEGEFYEVEGKLLDGYTVNNKKLLDFIATLFQEKEQHLRAVRIPLVAHKGEVHLHHDNTIEHLDVVAAGISNFVGSSNSRIHNIHTAMAQFNGLLLKAGDQFSFNHYLGEVDGSTGYHKELVIKGDKTIPEYGGGVCQVSSTFYRAALYGGLPIVERKPHSYAVSYYTPWGTDATVYPGVVDLKFRNNTAHDLIMHTYTDGTQLFVNYYGVSDGRKVHVAGPNVYGHQGIPSPKITFTDTLAPGQRQVKEYGHAGFSSWWSREIIMPDGEKIEETINSVYEARPAIVLEGATEEGGASEGEELALN